MFGGNSTPPIQPPPPPVPPPASAPTFGMSTMNAGKRNAPSGLGGSTILTSGAGLTTQASTGRKTLLGQ